MRISTIRERKQFARGAIFGLVLVAIKLIVVLPVDIADLFYGIALLITLIITAGDLLHLKYFEFQGKVLDFLIGFLFPFDCYVVLILLSVHLPN
jgi:hypothetical protein